MAIRNAFTSSDTSNSIFASIKAAEGSDPSGNYSEINHQGKSPALGAYQLKRAALVQVKAIDKDTNKWTGTYGSGANDFLSHPEYQDNAAAHYLNYIIKRINNNGSDVLGSSFTDPKGNDIPITELGFALASWENPGLANQIAHGLSFADSGDSNYMDLVSRFEAGALLEGFDLPDATKKAKSLYSGVSDYQEESTTDINLGGAGYSGPSLFREAGPTVTIMPSSDLKVSGGVILSTETNIDDISSVYATASADQKTNYEPDPSLQNPISFVFKQPVSDFSVQLINGDTDPVMYTLSDSKGDAVQTTLPSNKDGGNSILSLDVAGGATHFDVYANNDTWDFSINNIHYVKT